MEDDLLAGSQYGELVCLLQNEARDMVEIDEKETKDTKGIDLFFVSHQVI